MVNTTTEYKNIVANIDTMPSFTAKATITLKNNTVLNVTSEDIVNRGVKYTDSVTKSGTFQIGAAIINSHTLMLNNIEHKFDDYDFNGATIQLYIGIYKSNNMIEWLQKGEWVVDESTVASSIISLSCLDNMSKFDKAFSNVTITYPTTTLQMLNAVCTYCGVTFANTTFDNDDFAISRAITDDAITCREIVSYIAMIGGYYARCNNLGQLEFKWYNKSAFGDTVCGGDYTETTENVYDQPEDTINGGDYANYNQDSICGGNIPDNNYHHIYAQSNINIATDDIVITGVKIKAMGTKSDYGETVASGTTGYMIEITDNPLIQENTAQSVIDVIGPKIIGLKFRVCNITGFEDPSVEAGDAAIITDKYNKSYQTYINDISYTIGSQETYNCQAETPNKNNSLKYSAESKAIIEAKKQAEASKTAVQNAMEVTNKLAANTLGFYYTEATNDDGSTTAFWHDKPTLAESTTIYKQNASGFFLSLDGGETYTYGRDNNGNIVANILSAIGINASWMHIDNVLEIGNYLKLFATGKVEALQALIEQGCKIANMKVTQNGLEWDDGSSYENFKLSTQHNVQDFTPNGWSNEFKNTVDGATHTSTVATAYSYVKLLLDCGINGAGVNITYNSDGAPSVNIYTHTGANDFDDSRLYFNGLAFSTLRNEIGAKQAASSAATAASNAATAASTNASDIAHLWRNVDMILSILNTSRVS